jgi:hypothetical protein
MNNYIEMEEKLIKTQLTLYDTIKEKETLAKIDAILDKHSKKTPEHLDITVKTAEHLSKDGKIILPLKVKGRMLGVGRHKTKYYTREELIKAAKSYKGRKFPLKLDHLEKSAGATIGMVDKIYWSEKDQAILYEAHINDETHARNVVDGAHKDVSATIYSTDMNDGRYGITGVDLEFSELSIVFDGAYKENSIEVV